MQGSRMAVSQRRKFICRSFRNVLILLPWLQWQISPVTAMDMVIAASVPSASF